MTFPYHICYSLKQVQKLVLSDAPVVHSWPFWKYLQFWHWTLLTFFSCPEQLNRWQCHSLTDSVSHIFFCHTKSNPKDLLSLRHLIRVLRRHDLTEKDLQNLKIFRKSENFPEIVIKNCHQKFSSKIEINVWKSEKFPKIWIFFTKSEIFPKIWNFSQNQIFSPKI